MLHFNSAPPPTRTLRILPFWKYGNKCIFFQIELYQYVLPPADFIVDIRIMSSDNTETAQSGVGVLETDVDVLVLIKYQDVCVPVHKSVLIANSKVFETIFSERWDDNTSGM